MMLYQPQDLPVAGLIVPFVFLFLALYGTWNLLVVLGGRYYNRSGTKNWNKRLGLVFCISAVLLIVLQSLGQLTARDVIMLTMVVVLGYLYLTRSQFNATKH